VARSVASAAANAATPEQILGTTRTERDEPVRSELLRRSGEMAVGVESNHQPFRTLRSKNPRQHDILSLSRALGSAGCGEGVAGTARGVPPLRHAGGAPHTGLELFPLRAGAFRLALAGPATARPRRTIPKEHLKARIGNR